MLHLPRKRPGIAHTLLCILLAIPVSGVAQESHHVTAVRFWSLGDITRIAVETDGDFQIRSDRLSNPDRIFFDLAGTKPSLGKTLTVIPVADRFIQQIRVAEPQHNVTRVVLDLAGAAEASTSRLDNPSRLIIELRAPGGQHPAEGESSRPRRPERHEFQPPPAPMPASAPQRPQQALLEPPPVVESPTPMSAITASLNSKLSSPTFRTGAPVALAKSTVAPLTPATLPAPATVPSAALVKPSPPPMTASLPTPATGAPAPELALPAKRNASGDRSMIRVLGLKVGKIVIDPGHGGHDTGTIGPDGLREKDLVLDISKRLGALVESRMGSEVVLTRSDDTFIALERRTEIANETKADLFLSIHANSSPMRSAAGVETYYLNFTTSRAALEVAARENSGSQKNIYELQDLLQQIALKDKVEESREFASRIQTSLFSLSAKNNARAKDRGVKKAPFVVLIGAQMPSVLAEVGFISNAHDESTMKRQDYRERIAEALYKGLSGYASTLSHFQVAQRH